MKSGCMSGGSSKLPKPLDLPEGVFKSEEGRWCRQCPVCEALISHLRRNYCIGAHNQEQPCKRCSGISNHPSGMVGSVRVSWFNSFKKSALTRGYCWEIDIEFVDTIYSEQDGLCAYSGLPIGWSVQLWNHTASLDRIDNDRGYTEDNVQLVHKEVNMMRGSLEDNRFKELCSLIADKVKW